MKNIPLVLTTLASLAGCTSTPDAWLDHQATASTAGVPVASTSGQNRELPLNLSWAHLAALPQEEVSLRSLSQGTNEIQKIVYASTGALPGENMLTIERSTKPDLKLSRAPSADALRREMAEALPGVRMAIDPVIRSNSFGPYGVALGTSTDGAACVYAWQQVRSWPGLDKTVASVRLRYCDQKMQPATLANIMQSLSAGSSTLTTSAVPAVEMKATTILHHQPLPPRKVSQKAPEMPATQTVARQTKSQASVLVPMPMD